jgi:hypothetical protein
MPSKRDYRTCTSMDTPLVIWRNAIMFAERTRYDEKKELYSRTYGATRYLYPLNPKQTGKKIRSISVWTSKQCSKWQSWYHSSVNMAAAKFKKIQLYVHIRIIYTTALSTLLCCQYSKFLLVMGLVARYRASQKGLGSSLLLCEHFWGLQISLYGHRVS